MQFFTKAGMKNIKKAGDVPSVTIKITLPDGTEHNDEFLAKAEDCTWGTDRCDVHLGPDCSFVGDFQTYQIRATGKKGVGCDLTLESRAKPYRPGTAYFDFGDGEFYTWLCSVPQGEVEGTLTYGGKTVAVHGTGYHDHQWGNRFYLPEWNNWVWARQSFGDYSALIFDYVTSEAAGFQRIPIIFVQDSAGDIVFESREGVTCRIPEMTPTDKASGKEYPKVLEYEFESDGKRVSYTLEIEKRLQSGGFRGIPLVGGLLARYVGADVAYMRVSGRGTMVMSGVAEEPIERSGELIYEFMYPGSDCKAHMEC